jgi:hypothetical protein
MAAQVTNSSAGRTVSLSAVDDFCPAPKIFYRVSGGITIEAVIRTTFTIKNTDTVEYWGEDSSYNVSKHRTIAASAARDTIHPTVSATVAKVGDQRDVTVKASDNMPSPKVYYRVSGGAVKAAGSAIAQFTIRIPDTVEYWAVDSSGNASLHKWIASAAPSVRLIATPSTATYPQVVTLTAVAANAETDTAVFEVRYEGSTESTILATVKSTTGTFVTVTVPARRAYYRVTMGSVSGAASVFVSAQMSRPTMSTTQVRVGKRVTFAGTIRPKHPVGYLSDGIYKVAFWKWNARTKKWAESGTVQSWKIAALVDDSTSRWSYSRTFWRSQVGTWRVRFYHQCPRHKGAYSAALTFTVK